MDATATPKPVDLLYALAAARLTAERKKNLARAEAIAHYERAAKLALNMGAGERVLGHLGKYSAAEIESAAQGLERGLDVLAVQRVAGVA